MKSNRQNSFKSCLYRLQLILPLIACLLPTAAAQINAQTVNSMHKQLPVSAQAARVKQIYSSQTGVRETTPNSGAAVEMYLRYVNLPKGNPWCAAFVCWVLSRAGVANPRTGWSPGLFPASKVIWERAHVAQSNRLASGLPHRYAANGPSVNPATADVFGIFFPEKNRIAHVGFIDQWDGTWLTTVEGNTNLLGSREGDGVYRKRRLVRSVYKVARYVD